MTKIFKTPFAALGDKKEIPDQTQTDGSLSYEQGLGVDYQRDYEDPQAKDIPREGLNQLLFDITQAIGELQKLGYMQWQPGQYQAGERVAEGGIAYKAARTTTQKPPHADWEVVNEVSTPFTRTIMGRTTAAQVRSDLQLGTAATRNVGVSSGDVLGVGARNWGSMTTPTANIDFNDFNDLALYPQSGASYLYSTKNQNGPTSEGVHVLTMKLSDSHQAQLGIQHNGRAYVRSVQDGTILPWSEILRTDSLLGSTGQSTEYPMTQKATTDALNTKADKKYVDGVSLGVGQRWVDVTGSRSADTVYTNNDGRPIMIAVTSRRGSGNNSVAVAIKVDDVIVGRSVVRYGENEKSACMSAVIPAGSTYSALVDSLYIWSELR